MGIFDKVGDFLSGKQTATMQPWKPARGALQSNLTDARRLYEGGGFRTDPYQGERVSPFSAMSMSGLGMLQNIEGQTPQTRAAMNDMLSGETMYRDFDTIRKTVGDQTQARLAGVFAGGGINSSLAQDTYARGLGEALAGVEYGAYNDAQNRRLAALGLAPEMQGMDMRAAGARLTGGGMLDDYNQRLIDANMNRHYETQDADMNALMRYSGLVQGIAGMGGNQTAKTGLPIGDLGNLLSGAGSAMTAGATLFGR